MDFRVLSHFIVLIIIFLIEIMIIRDMIIGFADGLTVPFALTAGLSSLGSSKLVIVGGLAELFSGAISMGLGAYLAAVTDREHYKNEIARERREVCEKPGAEKEEIFDIFAEYGITREASQGVVDCLVADEDNWIKVCLLPWAVSEEMTLLICVLINRSSS